MTPRERVLRFFRREPIDRMPLFSGQGMVVLPAIQAMNLRFPEIHLTGENMAGSAMKTADGYADSAGNALQEAIKMIGQLRKLGQKKK
jgi:hypothetical protein